MTEEQIREKVWDRIYEILKQTTDLNQRAIIVQTYIAQGGPVPNSLGEKIREALKTP